MLNINEDVQPRPRPMPVLLLLDASGSMSENHKIDTLNQAVVDMIETLKTEKEYTFIMAVITFGEEGGPRVYLPYTRVQEIQWQPLPARRDTPMGQALKIAKEMLEDKIVTPSRSLRPTVVLISDGHPTDSWKEALEAFTSEGRSGKCDRWAMGINTDSKGETVLRRFASPGQNPERFFTGNADRIPQFFKAVTMSVSVYTKKTSQKGPLFRGLGSSLAKGRSDDNQII